MIVIMASTAVATFTLPNQSMVGAVSILRLFVLILGSTLGVYGVMIGFLGIVAYTSKLTSFGISYLSPVSPINWKQLPVALLALPWRSQSKRVKSLHPVDPTRQGEDSA
jgi:Bacillus/Clostridium GerA spore germination protein